MLAALKRSPRKDVALGVLSGGGFLVSLAVLNDLMQKSECLDAFFSTVPMEGPKHIGRHTDMNCPGLIKEEGYSLKDALDTRDAISKGMNITNIAGEFCAYVFVLSMASLTCRYLAGPTQRGVTSGGVAAPPSLSGVVGGNSTLQLIPPVPPVSLSTPFAPAVQSDGVAPMPPPSSRGRA